MDKQKLKSHWNNFLDSLAYTHFKEHVEEVISYKLAQQDTHTMEADQQRAAYAAGERNAYKVMLEWIESENKFEK